MFVKYLNLPIILLLLIGQKHQDSYLINASLHLKKNNTLSKLSRFCRWRKSNREYVVAEIHYSISCYCIEICIETAETNCISYLTFSVYDHVGHHYHNASYSWCFSSGL